MIRCKGYVIGLFRPGRRAGSRRVTGRDVTRPTGDVSFRDQGEQARKHHLFQTLVRGAVMMIRPPTASIGDRKCLRADLFQLPQEHKPLASTSGVGHRRDRGSLDGATTFTSSSRGLRRHAAWRVSMTRLPINWFHQTSGVSTTSGVRRVRNGRV